MEFACLEAECAADPLMCYICKDYGRHKGHAHNLLEAEAEKGRAGITLGKINAAVCSKLLATF